MSTNSAVRPADAPAAATQSTQGSDAAARAVGAVALGYLALVHVQDLPDTYTASHLVGAEYIALIAVSIGTAAALLARRASRTLWLVAGFVAGSAMVAYVLSRTTGIPGDHADIGNWHCALGLAALTTESFILVLSAWCTLSADHRRPRAGRRNRRSAAEDASSTLRKTTPSSWTVNAMRVSHQLRSRASQ